MEIHVDFTLKNKFDMLSILYAEVAISAQKKHKILSHQCISHKLNRESELETFKLTKLYENKLRLWVKRGWYFGFYGWKIGRTDYLWIEPLTKGASRNIYVTSNFVSVIYNRTYKNYKLACDLERANTLLDN